MIIQSTTHKYEQVFDNQVGALLCSVCEEFARLAETRLAQITLNYLNIYYITLS